MREIEIAIACDNGKPVTYVFENFPVLVGRDTSCTLSICHQSVPRKLFRAWLENDGRTARVEPCPNLSNPLYCDGRPIFAGVTGSHLQLAVGPVEIQVRPLTEASETDKRKTTASHLVGKITLGALALLLLCLAFGRLSASSQDVPKAMSIPDTLLFAADFISTEDADSRTPNWLIQSAQERMERKNRPVENRVSAALLLHRAQVALRLQDPQRAKAIQIRERAIKQRLIAEFRNLRRELLAAQTRNDATTTRRLAEKLRPYLTAETEETKRTVEILFPRK